MFKIIDKYLLIIVALIIVTYRTSIWLRPKTSIIIAILMICMSGIYFLGRILLRISKVRLERLGFILPLYLTIIIILLYFQKSNKYMFFIDFFIVFSCIFIINIYCKMYCKDILIIINKVIISIAIISLFFYIFGEVLSIIKPMRYEELNWGRNFIVKNYYGLYYSYQTKIINGISIPRNSSIFLEPGLFACFLTFSLWIEYFYKKNCNKLISIIIVSCIVTTFSTTGLIFIIIILGYKLLQNKKSNKLIKLIKRVISPIIIVLLISISVFIIKDKINGGYGNKSFSVRVNDIEIGIEVFKEKKLLGWGYLNSDEYKSKQSSSIRGDDISGGSNGLIVILYQGGIALLSIYLITLFITLKKMYINIGKESTIFLNMFIIIYLISLPIMYTWFLMYFMTDGLVNFVIGNKNINRIY